MSRIGGVGPDSLTWTSRYGSVVTSMYGIATVDGINEAGLVGNVLYLSEADYGTDARAGQPGLSIGAWVQYVLDNFATVDEVVAALAPDEIRIVAPVLPSGDAAAGHLAVNDPTGDSAIFEYLDGKLVIHHGPEYTVMTNSPPYDEQLAISGYWDLIGGATFLPGTTRASDRFARVSYFLNATPRFDDPALAVASVFSNMRAISVPLGLNDPREPNIASTIWRTVTDSNARRYYFDSAMSPYVFWVDLDQVDLATGAPSRRLSLKGHPAIGGDQSAAFEPAEPFAWLS
jgi:choloylglycine hydrolase